MLEKKEIAYVLVSILVLSLAVSIWDFGRIFFVMSSFFFIFMINIVAKEIASIYYESKIEHKIWEIYRYGWIGVFSGGIFHPSKNFKKPIPIGAILPLITSVLSFGYFIWMSVLVFDAKSKISRAAKRHGLYSFSEMSEEHMGYIAASGILANLLFSILGYLAGFSEFAELGILYAFFNLFPISDLDGNKIFFGNMELWAFLAALSMIALGFSFFII